MRHRFDKEIKERIEARHILLDNAKQFLYDDIAFELFMKLAEKEHERIESLQSRYPYSRV